MILYLKILFKNYPVKFVLSTLLFLLLSAVLGYAISDFLYDPEDLSLQFIIFFMQTVYIIQYIFFRLIWKQQLILIDDKIFYEYVLKKDLGILDSYKIKLVCVGVLAHFILSNFLFLLIHKTFYLWYVFLATAFLGSFFTIFIYLIDFMRTNKIALKLIEFMMFVILVIFAAIFYFPSLWLFNIALLILVIMMIVNIFVIRRKYNAKNK